MLFKILKLFFKYIGWCNLFFIFIKCSLSANYNISLCVLKWAQFCTNFKYQIKSRRGDNMRYNFPLSFATLAVDFLQLYIIQIQQYEEE